MDPAAINQLSYSSKTGRTGIEPVNSGVKTHCVSHFTNALAGDTRIEQVVEYLEYPVLPLHQSPKQQTLQDLNL